MSGYRRNKDIKSKVRFRVDVIKEAPIAELLSEISAIEGTLDTVNSTLEDLDDRVTGLEP